MKIGDTVHAKALTMETYGEIEDIYKSELGNPSLYKLKGSTALFEEREVTSVTSKSDDDAS